MIFLQRKQKNTENKRTRIFLVELCDSINSVATWQAVIVGGKNLHLRQIWENRSFTLHLLEPHVKKGLSEKSKELNNEELKPQERRLTEKKNSLGTRKTDRKIHDPQRKSKRLRVFVPKKQTKGYLKSYMKRVKNFNFILRHKSNILSFLFISRLV